MSTSSTNNKSQQIGARFPHGVVNEMDSLLVNGESRAQFIISAVRGEIARRQLGGTDQDTVAGMVDQFSRIAELGRKSREFTTAIIIAAEREMQKAKKQSDGLG